MKSSNLKYLIVLASLLIQVQISIAQTPPYFGTIFIEPGILTDNDCSTLSSVTYAGQGSKWVYDRRVNDWVYINAYLFDVVWNDLLTAQAIVNPEFTLSEATAEANKYALKIGQLPHCLRTDVNEIWIHKGDFDWGGGNNSILIHTGRALFYEALGISEETLIHEASHTSLDASHATAAGWLMAQSLDNNFISTYAQQNQFQEDIAESFLTWLAVRHFATRISTTNYNIITQNIPNRLLYFDAQNFNLNPIPCATTSADLWADSQTYKVYPNPTTDLFYIEPTLDDNVSIEIYNSTGQLLDKISKHANEIDLSAYPDGLYLILLKKQYNTSTFRVVKNNR